MLSIASGLLIFAYISFHLNFDSFHKDDDRIYRIVTQQKRDVISYQSGVPSPLGELVRTDYDFEESIARKVAFQDIQVNVNRDGQLVKYIEDAGVTFAEPAFFEIFNFPLKSGTFTKEFEEPNKAYITESLARKYFGESSKAIGESMRMDNSLDFTVIGILKDLPANTAQKSEIYLSYKTLKEYNDWFINSDSWGGISSNMHCFIKLKPGVNPAQVEAAMQPFPAKYRPQSSNIHTYLLQPLNEMHFNPNYDGVMPIRTLWTLGIIGLFLLISACLNFVNLATAQVFNRLKEVGVRKSLGSKKEQLFWQFLTETSLIAFVATVLGTGLAYLVFPYMNELFDVRVSMNFLKDPGLLLFIFSAFVLTTIVSGSYPGVLLAGFKPISALKGKLDRVNIGGLNLRRSLIIVQFVISQVLIIGMLVIVKQMRFAQNADLGFDKEAVVLVPVTSEMKSTEFHLIKERLKTYSDIRSTSVCLTSPTSDSNWGTSVIFENKTEQEDFSMIVRSGDADYLETFGLELVAGRNIYQSDTLTELLVNQTFLKKMNFSSPEDALGKRISIGGNVKVPIVGVVKDFNDQSLHEDISAVGIGAANEVFYSVAVKLNPQNISGGLAAVEKEWTAINPDGVFSYEFVDEKVAGFYQSEQTILSLIKIFTMIAIFIGAMGLYGLVSFMVERKTKEIGVRKVLGGSVESILWLFGKEFVVLVSVSFLLAAPIAWWFSKEWLQDFEFQTEVGIGIFLASLGISAVIAFASVLYKSLRASLINPVESLRSE